MHCAVASWQPYNPPSPPSLSKGGGGGIQPPLQGVKPQPRPFPNVALLGPAPPSVRSQGRPESPAPAMAHVGGKYPRAWGCPGAGRVILLQGTTVTCSPCFILCMSCGMEGAVAVAWGGGWGHVHVGTPACSTVGGRWAGVCPVLHALTAGPFRCRPVVCSPPSPDASTIMQAMTCRNLEKVPQN